jgi:hypothetical protein
MAYGACGMNTTTHSPRKGFTAAVARILGCSEATVRQLADRGVLQVERTADGKRIFDLDDAERVARERAERRAEAACA